MNIYES
jgi:DNA-binding NarL/FixJ family response regulator